MKANWLVYVWLIYWLIMNFIAYILYVADKGRAQKGAWRIRERTLKLFGFLGGAVGAIAAMKMVRHKTQHGSFWLVNSAGLIWQVGLTLYLLAR